MGKLEDKVYYLDDERKKLWAKVLAIEKKQFVSDNDIQNLEVEVKNKTSDYEDSAKQSSKKASEFRNRCEDAKNTAFGYLEEVKLKLEDSKQLLVEVEGMHNTVITLHDDSIDKNTEIESVHESITENNAAILQKIAELNALFAGISEYEAKIDALDSILGKNQDYQLRSEGLYKSISARKKEVDELYYGIIGFSEKDEETGEETNVPGLKDELEGAYEKLKSGLSSTQAELENFKLRAINNYDKVKADAVSEFESTLTGWKSSHAKIVNDIEALLPNALTAGLSYAYSVKKESEILESKSLNTKFAWAIGGMVCVSLIPFAVSLSFWLKKVPLEKVVYDMPRLVIAILPLYIPVLWLAYSANKSLKLSKRLIEEYTHKEVLSKTFEGLSRQIENIENKEISFDLRTKLLYNILEVNSENPGKLITDYNKSDHPLMDALDKSFRLANAVDKLAEVPGLSKLAKILDDKAREKLQVKQRKANEGLNILPKEKKKVEKDVEDDESSEE
ncbi:hypothetical protein GMST_07320 [Geomonas silvestris]|uniref:Uncharacterized protein n=1 Tax=Geomonas silvestris TaxID=2740184 RepID=A0A6V8MEK3_9BACT|nr:hypothetical protein [Geomonas silvestris]GFO58407.1 hypothetical protein GMST_07320 [Geomonas silvestris]